MKATIIEDKCTGCGMCPNICPDVFELEGTIAIVKTDPVPASCEDETIEAADSCPTEAIAISGG